MPTFPKRQEPFFFQIPFRLRQCIDHQRLVGNPPAADLRRKFGPIGKPHFGIFHPCKTHSFEKINTDFLSQAFQKVDRFVNRTSARPSPRFVHHQYNKLILKNFGFGEQGLIVRRPLASEGIQCLLCRKNFRIGQWAICGVHLHARFGRESRIVGKGGGEAERSSHDDVRFVVQSLWRKIRSDVFSQRYFKSKFVKKS